MAVAEHSLDSILLDIGEFGKYQFFVVTLFSISVTLNSAINVLYVFTAKDLQYRCYVPGCDSNYALSDYNPEWLSNALPFDGNEPDRCQQFEYNISTVGNCSFNDFNRNITKQCNSYVYEAEEVTIVQDFGIHCDDNLWRLTLIGTIHGVGLFVGLPIWGYLSDRYGRRTLLIWGMILAAISGIIQTFATTYIWFIILEFLTAAWGAGAYLCGFILGVELVGPGKRVLIGTIMCGTFATGEIFAGAVAWLTLTWRTTMRIVFVPGFIMLSYYWLTPESVRWLLSKGRTAEAITILKKVATVNGKAVPENALEDLKVSEEKIEVPTEHPIAQAFKSKLIIVRFFNCCICWMILTFLYYGLTLNSVALAGDSHLDFILTALVELPSYIVTILTLDRVGRRLSQSASFLLTGVACLGFIFTPDDFETIKLCLYLVGKFGATTAFTVFYVLISEIFPTNLRNSLMGVCSMIGRIGSMVAPQIPLLIQIWKPLPLALFAALALLATFLTWIFPETSNVKLPDTVLEAENVGQTHKEKIKSSF